MDKFTDNPTDKMCLSKVYYNTYADGEKDVTEKTYACREGRRCSHPEVRKYDRKFPFSKLGDVHHESHKSVSERKPTPYFSSKGSKSPSPSGRHYDPFDDFDQHHKHHHHHHHHRHRSPRHDPRDRYEREGRKRSGSLPQIIYDRPRSRSHDYSRDIPLGVSLADDYGRRKSSSRSRSRDDSGRDNEKYYRRRTEDPHGYVFVSDQDERRRQRREQRRMSSSSYHEPSSSAGGAMDNYDPHRHAPRRASTVVHNSDGTLSTFSSGLASSKAKSIRWDDEVHAKRNRQNAEIANRPVMVDGSPKGILKKSPPVDPRGKGKGRDVDDVDELRRAVQRMEIPSSSRSRDRDRGGVDDWSPSRKRSKIYATGGGADDRFRYF